MNDVDAPNAVHKLFRLVRVNSWIAGQKTRSAKPHEITTSEALEFNTERLKTQNDKAILRIDAILTGPDYRN